MNSSNKISFIIPVYNVLFSYLEKCIESIINQTYRDIEIIIVNDGSKKELSIEYRKLKEYDNRILYYEQENKGVSSARNFGIENSSGRWISFVDADDWIENDYCKKMINTIANNDNIDIIIAQTYKNYNTSELKIYNKASEGIVDKNEIINSILNDKEAKYKYVDTPWAKLFKKEFIIKNNLRFNTKLKLAEDGLFNYEAYYLADKIVFINELLYHYRINTTSVCQRFNKNLIKNYNIVFDLYEKLFYKYNIKKDYNYYYFGARQITNFINRYFYNRKNSESHLEKINELKMIKNDKIYLDFIKNVNINKLRFSQKVIIILFKLRFYNLILFIGKLKNLKKNNI